MKRLLLIFLLSVLFFSTNAQLVTISATNQMPQVNDTIKYIDANTFGFVADGVGPVTSTMWDFSALMNAGTEFQYWYIDASTTPQAANYPNANLARENSGGTGYDYYETTGTKINRWGMYVDAANWIINNAPATEFQFPITAGGSYNSTYSGDMSPFGVGEDSVKIETGQVSVSADRQGILILPNGTYTDVLRLHLIESFHIKVYMMGMAVMDVVVQDDYYYWYKDLKLLPILIYGTTTQDGSQIAEVLRYQKSCDYFYPETAQICDGSTLLWHGITCDTAGVYYDNYTTVGGCDSIYELTLTVNNPTVDLGPDTTICDYESILLDAGNGYTSYLWSELGATTQTILVDSNGTGLGTNSVYVIIVDANGCVNSDTIAITFDDCTDIENAESRAITIFPNPTNGKLYIDGEFINIRIYNVIGEILDTTKSNILELNKYEQSILILHIETKSGIIQKKVILEK